jgi:superfamily II DNA or RNA helicase
VGATGIGKTEVALNLLREADYSNGRLAFFLVPNRRLAEQQERRVREATALATALCVGMELDLWTVSKVRTARPST